MTLSDHKPCTTFPVFGDTCSSFNVLLHSSPAAHHVNLTAALGIASTQHQLFAFFFSFELGKNYGNIWELTEINRKFGVIDTNCVNCEQTAINIFFYACKLIHFF